MSKQVPADEQVDGRWYITWFDTEPNALKFAQREDVAQHKPPERVPRLGWRLYYLTAKQAAYPSRYGR